MPTLRHRNPNWVSVLKRNRGLERRQFDDFDADSEEGFLADDVDSEGEGEEYFTAAQSRVTAAQDLRRRQLGGVGLEEADSDSEDEDEGSFAAPQSRVTTPQAGAPALGGVTVGATADDGLSSSDSGIELEAESDSNAGELSSDDETSVGVPGTVAPPASTTASIDAPTTTTAPVDGIIAAPVVTSSGPVTTSPADVLPVVTSAPALLLPVGGQVSSIPVPTGAIASPPTNELVDGAPIEIPAATQENRAGAVGIAFGATGAVILIMGAVIFFIRRRRNKGGSQSRGGIPRFQWSFPRLPTVLARPFERRTASRDRHASTTTSYRWQGWDGGESTRSTMPPPPPLQKTNTAIIDNLIRAAYDAEQGQNDMERRNDFYAEKDYVDEKLQQQQYGVAYSPGPLPPVPAMTAGDGKPVDKWLQGLATPKEDARPTSGRGILSLYSRSNDDSMSSSSSDFFDGDAAKNKWTGVAQVNPPRPAYDGSNGRENN